MTDPKAKRASGFHGPRDARRWTKDSAYGVRYQCTMCGRVTLGMYGIGDDREMHNSTCPRIKAADHD